MKKVPNSITVLRILLSAVLFFLKPFSTLFWIVYFTCGLSDMLDGYIARKTNSESRFGALLDSIGDIVFMSVVVVVIIPGMWIPVKIWICIGLVAVVRVVSLLAAYHKYHAFAILHTYLNKATGFMLFLSPFLYIYIDVYILGGALCTLAGIAAIEELIINITSSELARDTKGILWK